MCRSAEGEGAGHLYFCFPDRIGRNLRDHEEVLEAARAGQFTLHIVGEGRVFDQNTPDGDYLAAEFSSLTAKHYSRDLSRRAKDSMDRKAKQGTIPTRPPIGFRNVKAVREDGQVLNRGGTIGLVPDEAEVVRFIFKKRLEGWSLVKINEAVLDSGLLSERRTKQFRRPGKATRIKDILTNPFYMGEFDWRGVRYVGTHEVLIQREEWEAVQESFHGKPTPKRYGAKEAPYAGMFKCAECGCAISYDPKTRATVATSTTGAPTDAIFTRSSPMSQSRPSPMASPRP